MFKSQNAFFRSTTKDFYHVTHLKLHLKTRAVRLNVAGGTLQLSTATCTVRAAERKRPLLILNAAKMCLFVCL